MKGQIVPCQIQQIASDVSAAPFARMKSAAAWWSALFLVTLTSLAALYGFYVVVLVGQAIL